jgi:hypothetical protein
MWGGNGANTGAGASTVQTVGPPTLNDYSFMLNTVNTVLGYYLGDYNMDGTVQSVGPPSKNDYTFLLNVVGSNSAISQHK